MTPYYTDDLVTIYHADCKRSFTRSEFAALGFDAIVTDPPYGISLDTDSGRPGQAVYPDIVGDDGPFDPSWLLALDVPLLLWGANHYADRLPLSAGWVVWNKVLYDGAFGSKSMDKRQAEVELGWTNFLARPKGYRHLWDGVYRDSEHGKRYHPAQKPADLMGWCLSLLPKGVGVVLDPYMGAGPTLEAARSQGRKAIGIEIEERYCEIAAQRCSQEVLGLSFSEPTASPETAQLDIMSVT